MKTILLAIALMVGISACGQPSKPVEKWSKKQLNSWFEKGAWREGWQAKPDKTTSRAAFAKAYFANQARWEQAFKYLSSLNLDELNIGTYKLDGDKLFASVSEYPTKPMEGSRFEAHKRYVDIQYVYNGKELIGVAPLDSVQEVVPYNTQKDIALYIGDSCRWGEANPNNFFILMPGDAHKPCIEIEGKATVRKVVIKLLLE